MDIIKNIFQHLTEKVDQSLKKKKYRLLEIKFFQNGPMFYAI
jgi:hypothetical protein